MEHIMNAPDGAHEPYLDGLSEAALAAVAGLARLGEADRQAALQALGLAALRRVWTPRVLGEIPTATALVPERNREAIYGSGVWAAHYRRRATVVVYVLQCVGLGHLSADLDRVSLCKLGTSTPRDAERRRTRLGSDGYGSCYRAARRYVCDAGFDNFDVAPRLQLAGQHPLSPVRLCQYGLEVDLPEDLSPGEFEAELNRALMPLRLQTFADSEAGRNLCARLGLDPARLRRFYRRGTTYASATEITLLRPQADLGALARITADIVIGSVLRIRAKRPVR